MSRFFVEDRNIREDKIVIDDPRDVRHMVKALRMKPGEMVDVSDSREWEYKGRILSLAADAVMVKILDRRRFAKEPKLRVTLYQGIPKQGKMESVIQKSVELGVSAVVPVFTARTIAEERAGFAKKTARWRRVAEEAVKQCGRGVIPPVDEAIGFAEAIRRFASADDGYEVVLFPYEAEEERSVKQVLREFPAAPRTAAVIIGPEGGFSEEEAAALKNAGCESVSLGKTILRTETAGPAALAMMMYEWEL